MIYTPTDRHLIYDGQRWLQVIKETISQDDSFRSASTAINSFALLLVFNKKPDFAKELLRIPLYYADKCKIGHEVAVDSLLNLIRIELGRHDRQEASSISDELISFYCAESPGLGRNELFRAVADKDKGRVVQSIVTECLNRNHKNFNYTLRKNLVLIEKRLHGTLLLSEIYDVLNVSRPRSSNFIYKLYVKNLRNMSTATCRRGEELLEVFAFLSSYQKMGKINHRFWRGINQILRLEGLRPDLRQWISAMAFSLADEDTYLLATFGGSEWIKPIIDGGAIDECAEMIQKTWTNIKM